MRYLLLFIFLMHTFALFAQDSDPWIKFVDPKTNRAGYKDLTGTIRVPIATFDEIIGILTDLMQRFEVRKAGKVEISYAGRTWIFVRDSTLTDSVLVEYRV